MMPAPELLKKIPSQVVNEQAAYGPFDLKPFFSSPAEEAPWRFSAALVSGQGLPKGMICTADGILTGIPAKDTQGNYEIKLTVENAEGEAQETIFTLMIKPTFIDTADYFDKLKSQIWEALEHNLPIPDLGDLNEQQITPLEIYYLLERWGILTVWDAFNLDPPGERVLLNLEGASPHYYVFDRGSCLVAAPKDLYSHERTLADGLETARAVAREVYRRDWTIQMAGFDKFMRAVWIEAQHLGDQYGKYIEVVNFSPSTNDVKLYSNQAIEAKLRGNVD